uniref:Uncharacterized protein n=1 Tax=Phenylobacterium glaciei TaxID=2803784 RepID=A0A974S9V0_9CAUL|nr:hypothetical protein JKL49_25195 [Phenylobacterium glaciei]
MKIDTGIPYSVASLGMGGGGGKGGNGGAIKVTTSGAITTTGEGAHGIYAQSVGGGGGIGGTGANTFPAAIALSGSNGDKGTAGAITIIHTGDIKAFGDGARHPGPERRRRRLQRPRRRYQHHRGRRDPGRRQGRGRDFSIRRG